MSLLIHGYQEKSPSEKAPRKKSPEEKSPRVVRDEYVNYDICIKKNTFFIKPSSNCT